MELANKSVPNDQESTSRALHILSSFSSGIAYSTFKCRPSSVQLLRAHHGFKEKSKEARSAWTRGAIDDQSLAIICSAALFEELTTGCGAALEVIHQAFMAVLPGNLVPLSGSCINVALPCTLVGKPLMPKHHQKHATAIQSRIVEVQLVFSH